MARRATQLPGPVADSRAMLSFQRLEVYQPSIEFLALALEIIAELPSKGHADIADQLRRAAQSQPLNIAEGAGRTSRPDVAKHYTIARGSAMECSTSTATSTSMMSVNVKAQVDVNRARTCASAAYGLTVTLTDGAQALSSAV